MLVLQRNYLREEFKRHLARIIATQQSSGGVPNRPSLLEDLPTRPPTPPCFYDKFIFHITEVSSEHIPKINGIILSEAKESITFACPASAVKSLTPWLKDPDLLTSPDHPDLFTESLLRLRKSNLLNFLKQEFCTSDSAEEIAESNWWNGQEIRFCKAAPRYL